MNKDSTSAVNSEDGSNHEPLNAAEQESFIRKINWRIIPLLFLSYMFMGIDKSNISNGRIYGLEKDLGMISGQFAWVVSIFYFGYLLFMLPLTLLFRRSLRPSIWLAVIIISSGVTASCMTFSQSFGSLMVLRFLLGCAESGFGPSMTYFISQWYTRKEHARTFARYYSASQIGGIIKGFAAYGVGFIGKGVDGKGWSPWRWLFLVEGLPTLVIGVLIMFVLPNYPNNTKILTERERQYAVQCIKDDLKQQQVERVVGSRDAVDFQDPSDPALEQGNGTDNDAAFSTGQILRAEVWAAISSGFSVALQLYGFCLGIINASFSAYMPTIIRSMGYGSLETQLLTIPQYIVGLIALNVVAEVSDRQGKRARYAIGGGIISTLSIMTIAIIGDRARWVRYACLNVIQPVVAVLPPIIFSWIFAVNTSVVVNKYHKGAKQDYALKARLASATAMLSIWGSIGGVVGGQMFRDEEAPAYRPTLIASTILFALSTLCIAVIHHTTKHIALV